MTRASADTFDRIASPYDRGMAPLERLWLRRMRRRLLAHARGHVLEIGVGTGANLPYYPPTVRITAVDESLDMLAVAAQRARGLDGRVALGQANVEHLVFPADTFDTVAASLVLCSVVDLQRTLDEIRRVLREPGGRLLLLEHMRPRVQPLTLLVDLANLPWYAFNGRCHLNRETQQAVSAAGFEVEHVERKVGGFLRLIVARIVPGAIKKPLLP
ncbi:MAG: methyltransferase domain-containing protein [Anaerolineae bacterium]|nr:methyltransferase domain-containing protein [Anaerolineae bacterium]